jgi:hypothetical protein
VHGRESADRRRKLERTLASSPRRLPDCLDRADLERPIERLARRQAGPRLTPHPHLLMGVRSLPHGQACRAGNVRGRRRSRVRARGGCSAKCFRGRSRERLGSDDDARHGHHDDDVEGAAGECIPGSTSLVDGEACTVRVSSHPRGVRSSRARSPSPLRSLEPPSCRWRSAASCRRCSSWSAS